MSHRLPLRLEVAVTATLRTATLRRNANVAFPPLADVLLSDQVSTCASPAQQCGLASTNDYPATKRVRTPDGFVFHSHIRFGKNRVLPRMMAYGRPFAGLEMFQPAYPFLLEHCERPFRSPYAQPFFVNLKTLRAKPLFATHREVRAFEELGKSEFALMKHSPDQSFPDHFSASTLH